MFELATSVGDLIDGKGHDEMSRETAVVDVRPDDWERSERMSFRIALAIALMPIPAATLISWSLGSPPWRPKPAPKVERAASVGPEVPGHTVIAPASH